MAAVAPMPVVNNGNVDIGRPGQQLLPGYVVKLLKTLKIPFGTDRTMNGVDVDPTIALIGHVIDCIGALRDINKVYRAKGSLASRSVGTRVMFGFTAELGNVLLDSITFEPPADLSDSSIYYGQVASSILSVFPEIAAQVTPATGKVLLHHTALKASSTMALESIKMAIKAFPAGAWTADRTGALPLHWVTHNPNCSQEMINFLINANPKGPWVADMDGYLPLHWAVNQDFPNIDVIAALVAANASAAAKACSKGSLPLHWTVNRDRPHIGVMRALLQVHADGVRTFDKTGWLPIHQCVNRSDISLEALQLLIELYPQGLQCPNVNGQLPIHRALDQTSPSIEAIQMMLEAFPGSTKVADDEGYLPLHLALDCARPNPVIARMLIEQYPESAFHKSKDGLLPIHCIISSMSPVIEIIQQLLNIFPDSTESMAVDVIPVDESAEPETWQGEWIEKRWTPLSRAIDRGLDAIVMLFRDALQNNKQRGGVNGGGSIASLMEGNSIEKGGATKLPGLGASNATPKNLMPQSLPPLNAGEANASSPVGPGPSTSSAEATNQVRAFSQNRLIPGGNLDSDGEDLHNNMVNAAAGRNKSNLNVQDGASVGEDSRIGGRPNMGPPPGSPAPNLNGGPSLRDRAPGGMKSRERDRDHSRDRRRTRRESSRDRDGHHSRHRRDRDRRGYDDDDGEDSYYDDRRHREHRSTSRGHHHRRSTSRGHHRRESSRDRDHHRDRDRDHHRHGRDRSVERIYEDTEYRDDVGGGGSGQNSGRRDSKMRLMSGAANGGGGPMPGSDPPKSLLEAANRPTTRRGLDDESLVGTPHSNRNNNNYNSSGNNSVQRPPSAGGVYGDGNPAHSRDSHEEKFGNTAINIGSNRELRDERNGDRTLSMDELV